MGVDGCAGQEAPRPRGGPHRIRSTTRQPGLGSGQLLRIKVDSGSEYGTDGTDSGKVPYRRKIPGAPQVRGTTRRYRRYLRYRRYRACTRRAVSHVRRALTIYITRDGPVHFVLVSTRAERRSNNNSVTLESRRVLSCVMWSSTSPSSISILFICFAWC